MVEQKLKAKLTDRYNSCVYEPSHHRTAHPRHWDPYIAIASSHDLVIILPTPRTSATIQATTLHELVLQLILA